jgi:hypothetical protein
MSRLWNALSSFFGGDHSYRRYGGYGMGAGGLMYGLTRWFQSRRNRMSAASTAAPPLSW